MNKITAILGATTLALGITSSYLWMQVRGERAQRETLQARLQELERGAGPVDQAVNFSSSMPAAATLEASTPHEAGAAKGVAHAPTAGAEKELTERRIYVEQMRDMRERQRKLMSNPEYRAAMRAQQRMSLQQNYPDLASALRLQPEELEKLLDLLADQQLQSMGEFGPFEDPASAGTAAEQQQKMAEWRRRMEEEQSRREAGIAALLGPKYQDWQEYQGSLGARMQARELRNTLDSSAEPLRAEQIRPLVAAIAEAERLAATEMRNEMQRRPPAQVPSPEQRLAMLDQMIERTEAYQQRLHDAVLPHLTAAQLEGFDQMMKQQLDMQRAQLAMMREQQAAAARGEIPAGEENVIFGTQTVIVRGQQ